MTKDSKRKGKIFIFPREKSDLERQSLPKFFKYKKSAIYIPRSRIVINPIISSCDESVSQYNHDHFSFDGDIMFDFYYDVADLCHGSTYLYQIQNYDLDSKGDLDTHLRMRYLTKNGLRQVYNLLDLIKKEGGRNGTIQFKHIILKETNIEKEMEELRKRPRVIELFKKMDDLVDMIGENNSKLVYFN